MGIAGDFTDPADNGDVWKKRLASAAALIAALLFVALVFLVGHANQDRDRALAHERHSYEVLMLTRGLDAAMARSEAALGRFVISGDKLTGTLYYDNWNKAGRLLHMLAAATSDDPVQSELVKDLKDIYDERGDELKAPAVQANYHQGWAALSLFNQVGKSSTIDRMAQILSKIEANERSTLDFRSDRATAGTDRSNLFSRWLSVIGIATAAVAVVFGWLAIRGFTQYRIAEREAERAEILEYAVSERTRELIQANQNLQQEAATRAEAEAQLRQVQKLEAVGQLTGGIAHDFNNMLAVVVGGLDLAKRRLKQDPEEASRHLDNAMEGASRASALTRRLLSFARSEPIRSSGVAPHLLIAGMSELLDRTLGERIKIVIKTEGEAWLIWADPHQFENAIINLAINARDAIDADGTLTIRTATTQLTDNQIGALSAGDYVCVSVIDDGCGISPEVMDRVFEPFFTTKPVGKGTGLGLSQIFGFVRQSGGDVAIASAPGKGTTVSLYLPRHAATTSSITLPHITSVREAKNVPLLNANILVVEDDARVRIATVGGLEELGHHTLPCASGEEALEILAQRDDIDMVMTDVVMPTMSGPQLVKQVVKLYPDIAILFVTGYAGEAGDAEIFSDHDVLRKPFTIAALAASVEAALHKSNGWHPVPTIAAAG